MAEAERICRTEHGKESTPAFLQSGALISTCGVLEHLGIDDLPSSCSITITSIAPLKVAGFMEFQVLETEPLMLLTYCIPHERDSQKTQNAGNPNVFNTNDHGNSKAKVTRSPTKRGKTSAYKRKRKHAVGKRKPSRVACDLFEARWGCRLQELSVSYVRARI
jgi:hypothetical protein